MSRPTAFWLIRHALVEESARAFLYGSTDVPLCETTLMDQAPMYAALARRLPRPAVWGCTEGMLFGVLSLKDTPPASFRDKPLPFSAVLLPKPLKCCPVKRLPVIGVGNADEGFGALQQVFAVQINSAPLGGNVMHVGAGSYHTSTFFENGYNLAQPFVGLRRQGNDGFTAF